MDNEWQRRLVEGVAKSEQDVAAAEKEVERLKAEYPSQVSTLFDKVEAVANSINATAARQIANVGRTSKQITVSIRDRSFTLEDRGFGMLLGAWGTVAVTSQPQTQLPFSELHLMKQRVSNDAVWAFKLQQLGGVSFPQFGEAEINELYKIVFKPFLS